MAAPGADAAIIEVLLGVLATINMAAWAFLFREHRNSKDELRGEINELHQEKRDLQQSMFGSEHDPTDMGHMVETRNEFSRLHEKIDETKELQEEHYRDMKVMMQTLTHQLANEDALELDETDYELPEDE